MARFWPRPLLAQTLLGRIWLMQGWGPEGWRLEGCRLEGCRPKPRKSGAPKGGAPRGGRPKISRFFFPLPPQFSFFRSRDSPRGETCTFQGPGLQKHHQNSTKRPPREEERMRRVAGRGEKKTRNFGRSADGGPAEGSQGSAQILDAPTKILNTHSNDTPHNTTGDPAQGGLGQGGSLARRSMAQKKQDMGNKLSLRAAPLAKVFFGFKDGSQRFGHKTVCLKKEAKRRPGPKVVRPKKWSEKTKKTWKKQIRNSLLPISKIKK